MKFVLFSLFICVQLIAQQKATIGFVLDGEEQEQDTFYQEVKKEITDLLKDDYELHFITYVDNWDLYESRIALFKALENSEVDVVITVGVLPSFLAIHEPSLPKPTVIGIDSQFITKDTETLQSDHIAYYKGRKSLLPELKTFEEITHAKKIAIIGDESIIGLPHFALIREKLDAVMKDIPATPIYIPATSEPIPLIEILETSLADGVLLLPLWRMNEEDISYLIEGINLLKIPSFSFMGESDVRKGVLMTMTPQSEFTRSARRLALNTQEMLLSGNSIDIESSFFRSNELIINESTAREIHLDIPWKFLSSARLIDRMKPREIDRLSLWQAADIAIKQNLDLESERFFVKSGSQDVLRALSRLLPQLNADLRARIIDTNSAKFAFGNEPEKLIRGKLSFDQRLYDERSLADHSIERYLQKSRVYGKESFELDIILDTAVIYLVVLRIQAEKEIAEENLSLTKANLKRAHELVDSGQARLSEVYRWESEMATNLEELVSIQARLENTETEFNRLLYRPLNATVILKDVDPLSTDFLFDFGNLSSVVNSSKKFARYKEFMINLARGNSPDIKAIDQEILAQARDLTATERAFYLPTLTAFGEFSNNLVRGGAGNMPPPGISNAKLESAVGINLSYPLFTSGRRKAEKNKAVYELSRLQIDKGSLIQRVDESVIQAMDNMKASYENIFHAQKAQEAGEKNLVIVTNSYVRGIISIVDLLDAQNNAIVAKRNYSNSIYDYLIDFMQFQRTISQYDHYLCSKKQKEILMHLIDFVEGK